MTVPDVIRMHTSIPPLDGAVETKTVFIYAAKKVAFPGAAKSNPR